MTETVVVESFLVTDRRVTNLDAHLARFHTCTEQLFGEDVAAQIDIVVANMTAQIAGGRRFPRLEARDTGVTWLDRAAPPPRAVLRVADTPVADLRKYPQIKGPDLEWLSDAATPARARGCDDVVLIRNTSVAECSTAAVAIADGDQWLVPDQPGLASTTITWLAKSATLRSVTLSWDELSAAMARGQAYAFNALQGVRLLVGADKLAPDDFVLGLNRARLWRDAWLAEAQLLP